MRATKQLASKGSWEQCLEYDVVVGTPNCVSPAYQDVGKAFRRVKKDIFDLILIDEGHHAPARTWRILIESFPNARKVLFTATPFRRDKLEIPGSLIYSYSLAKALKDGVYCPIEFVGVSLPDPKHKHQLLIEEAKRVVKNERKAGRDSKLVIRTDHIRSAEKLERLYKRNSLTIGLVHSNRSLGHNREVIRQLRAGDLDGIIVLAQREMEKGRSPLV